jgi:hypothetical protein
MKEPAGYGDAEARRIIARAAEIDAQEKPLDASALRDIAAQAGISPASVDRALEEHQQTPQTLTGRIRRKRALIVLALIIAGMLWMFLRRTMVG